MVYTENDIEKIVSFKTWSDKKKIDELCRIDCDMYCNLGIDSTKTEKLKVKNTLKETKDGLIAGFAGRCSL